MVFVRHHHITICRISTISLSEICASLPVIAPLLLKNIVPYRKKTFLSCLQIFIITQISDILKCQYYLEMVML